MTGAFSRPRYFTRQEIIYIYIYAFSRRYPKRLTVHSSYYISFWISVCSLGIEPTIFCAANAMVYHWATGTSAYSNIGQTATFLCGSLLQNTFFLSNPSHVSSFPLRTVSPTLSARAPQFCLSSPVIIANKDSLQGSWRSGFRALKVFENQQNNWDWDQQLSEWTLQTSAVLIYLF